MPTSKPRTIGAHDEVIFCSFVGNPFFPFYEAVMLKSFWTQFTYFQCSRHALRLCTSICGRIFISGELWACNTFITTFQFVNHESTLN